MIGNFVIAGFIDEIDPDPAIAVAAAKEMGLDAVDLRNAWGINVTELTAEQLAEYRKIVEAHGLRVNSVGSPVNKVVLGEHADLRAELNKLERSCDAAKAVGTHDVRIFSPEVPGDLDAAWPRVRAWMTPFLQVAARHGVRLLHENDANFFGSTPEGSQLLIGALGGPGFQCVFDFMNATWRGSKPMDDWMPWIVPHLASLHIKDYCLKEQRVVPAGEGDGQILESLRYLIDKGWNGPLSLEPHLTQAGPMGGFSGSERFGIAVTALRSVMEKAMETSQ